MDALALIMTMAAYLLGSVSSAVLICRLLKLPDPRSVGSNNPGATNVLRIGGRGAAVSVLLCDMLKGTIPVWGGYFLGIDPIILGVIAIAACLGHMYPIFFHFKGGKRCRNRAWRYRSDWFGLNRIGNVNLAVSSRAIPLFILSGSRHGFGHSVLYLDV